MKVSATFTTLAATLLAASSAYAQSTCNQWAPCFREGYCDATPMFCMWGLCDEAKSFNSTSCWQPEGCADKTVEFASAADMVAINQYKGDHAANSFVSVFDPNYASVSGNNLKIDMKYDAPNNKGFGATVTSTTTIKYGRVTARVKTASIAKGVVSSFIIRNENSGDEIDFEFVGLKPNEVQTNYYYRDILDYTQMVPYVLDADTSADFHDYTIDWSESKIDWLVDGKVVRTLTKESTGGKFPDSESRISFSLWDAGNSDAQGTREWGGYPTPWSADTVYTMLVDSIKIQCSGGAGHDAEGSDSESSGSEDPATDAPSSEGAGSKGPATDAPSEGAGSKGPATDAPSEGAGSKGPATDAPSSEGAGSNPPAKCIPRPH